MKTSLGVMLKSVIVYCCLIVRNLTYAQNSYLIVKDGVYSKLTVSIGQSVPAKNCPQFLDNVEVGFHIILLKLRQYNSYLYSWMSWFAQNRPKYLFSSLIHHIRHFTFTPLKDTSLKIIFTFIDEIAARATGTNA